MAIYDDTASSVEMQGSYAARQSAEAAEQALDGAKQATRAGLEAGRAYATDAVNAAGRKLEDVKSQFDDLTQQTSRYVTEQPMRAVAMAAAAGFLFAVLLNGLRGSR